MQKLGDILKKFNPTEDKYVSREFQTFALYLAEKLQDMPHKSLYMKMAKTYPRPALEEALRFCVDSKTSTRGRLFMWKLKQMGILTAAAKKAKKSAM